MAKIALVFLLLFGLLIPITLTAASPDLVKWSWVNTPTEGEAGSWVLAGGSDVRHVTAAIDGTLYCYANPAGTSYRLFKSTDDGFSWSHTGMVKDELVAIATVPDDASVVYYATSSSVYKSTDAGNSFTPLPPGPGGVGTNNLVITSIDVARLNSGRIIAVGTRDADSSQYGGAYTLDENEVSLGWKDASIGNYYVYCVAFSPTFRLINCL